MALGRPTHRHGLSVSVDGLGPWAPCQKAARWHKVLCVVQYKAVRSSSSTCSPVLTLSLSNTSNSSSRFCGFAAVPYALDATAAAALAIARQEEKGKEKGSPPSRAAPKLAKLGVVRTARALPASGAKAAAQRTPGTTWRIDPALAAENYGTAAEARRQNESTKCEVPSLYAKKSKTRKLSNVGCTCTIYGGLGGKVAFPRRH